MFFISKNKKFHDSVLPISLASLIMLLQHFMQRLLALTQLG
jgi:hypothetical protein